MNINIDPTSFKYFIGSILLPRTQFDEGVAGIPFPHTPFSSRAAGAKFGQEFFSKWVRADVSIAQSVMAINMAPYQRMRDVKLDP